LILIPALQSSTARLNCFKAMYDAALLDRMAALGSISGWVKQNGVSTRL